MLVVMAVALLVIGPRRLPGMLQTLGKWVRKLRRMAFDMRNNSGIDDILRGEGLTGGLNELRELRDTLRGDLGSMRRQWEAEHLAEQQKAPTPAKSEPAAVHIDVSREYPPEGVDAQGSLPEDLAHQAYEDEEVEHHEARYGGETSAETISQESVAANAPLPEAPLPEAPLPEAPLPEAPLPEALLPEPPLPEAPAPPPPSLSSPSTPPRPSVPPRPSAPPRPNAPPRPSAPSHSKPANPAPTPGNDTPGQLTSPSSGSNVNPEASDA